MLIRWCRNRYKYYPTASSYTPPTFEFGHGLTYTTFDFSISDNTQHLQLGPTDVLSKSVAVKNTGTVDSDEVERIHVLSELSLH